MSRSFLPAVSGKEELQAIQVQGLQWTVHHAYHNSPFYRQRLQEAGVHPDHIRTLDDLKRLPFTTAEDLRLNYPFPLRAVPFDKIVRIHASSGTTGKRKVLCYTQKDVDDWAEMFARCYEMAGLNSSDRVQIAVGYGLWTAGVGFQLGCERFGAMAVPVGPGNTQMHCEMLIDMQSTVFCSTASMALLMAEEIQRRNLKSQIALRKIIMGAERHSESMDRRIKDLLDVEHVFDIPGLTELYGPGTGLDCELHQGIHYWADFYILEIIDPDTLEPVRPGDTGEMVVTTLRKEAAPLIRYRTRDLSRLLPQPCACGSPFPMHDRILGRSDDMFIIRAVNVYPGQIDHLLSGVAEIGSEYQVHLERREDGRDYMILKVERRPEIAAERDHEIAQQIRRAVRQQLLVSAEVDIQEYGTLPRSERKSKRVFDHR
ncbi:MAG: phenylacetate--CoA ligase [Deltaproteobacteria bacterium]|nr:phenylacetate--CoA ligase [Deltaproteobacteria bacterium]MBW2070754.1 phenylacetate--CoA ligase [Deltaproteobacteria bacterium]